MSLLKFNRGGLLYQDFFQSASLKQTLDVSKTVFSSKTFFTSYNISTTGSTRDSNILYIDTELKRTDKFEIFLEFYTSLSRNNYCLSGSLTSDWWTCPGINIDKGTDNKWHVYCCGGTTSSNNWINNIWASSEYKDIPIIKNELNTIKLTHIKDSDDYELYVNGKFITKWTTLNPYYGSVRLGIGGIYQNNNSFLYYPNNTTDYLTSRTYFKINDSFLERP